MTFQQQFDIHWEGLAGGQVTLQGMKHLHNMRKRSKMKTAGTDSLHNQAAEVVPELMHLKGS